MKTKTNTNTKVNRQLHVLYINMKMLKVKIFSLMCTALTACSTLPHAVKPDPLQSESISDDIYVVSHGWHTGVVLPATAIQARIPELSQRFHNTRFLEFGWGDKGFYQAVEITTGLTIKAIFWPTGAVMHVVAVPEDPYLYFPQSQVIPLCMNDVEYASLLRYIENSFARNSSGNVISMRNGLYGDSQFYEAVGDYFLMNTCNKWTAKALQSAGMDLWPTFKLTAGSITGYLQDSMRLKHNGSCMPLSQATMSSIESSSQE